MGLSFTYSGASNPRMSYRTTYPGLMVRLESTLQTFNVLNISTSGIAIKNTKDIFTKGETLEFSLLIGEKVFLSRIYVNVVHIDISQNFVGCTFKNLTRIQENKLDIFILKLQKVEIEKQKREQLALHEAAQKAKSLGVAMQNAQAVNQPEPMVYTDFLDIGD